jgi:hypothetical protein
MRWRKCISEIYTLGLFGALALGSHSTQRTSEEKLTSVHGEKVVFSYPSSSSLLF